MNIYNINDKNYINSNSYKEFMKNNMATGNLRVRAYMASEAIPVSGLKVVVSTVIDDNDVIFYEGYTDESGLTPKISLPVPKLSSDNLAIPEKTVYEIHTTYIPSNLNGVYKVNMYENICVVQNINIIPSQGVM